MCYIAINSIMQQIIKNQFNYQLIAVGSARTDQDYERRVKKRRHSQFYTGSPFLKGYCRNRDGDLKEKV